MSTDPRTDRPEVVHRLAFVVRLDDAFTGRPVPYQLDLSVPARGWRPVWIERDATYRFAVTNVAVPAGNVSVKAEDPAGRYLPDSFVVALPRTMTTYLIARSAWPTPLLRTAGETAVTGVVRDAAGTPAAGHRVHVFEPPLDAAAPFARTGSDGRFLFRLPGLKRGEGGVRSVKVFDAADVERTVGPAATVEVNVGQTAVVVWTVS